MVREFVNVFLEELTRGSLKRELEFTIDLKLGIELIVRNPYRMSTLELQELLDLGLIHPSLSPRTTCTSRSYDLMTS